MARTRKTITLDEKIEKAQESGERTKVRYDAAVKELRDLLEKERRAEEAETAESGREQPQSIR